MKLSIRSLNNFLLALLAISFPQDANAASRPANAVLLSSIKSLTLRGDKMTTARRVSPISQLSCTGGSAQGLYDVDTMRCTNSGSSYGSADVEWTCKASLPPEFKLGSTDVVCEGYANADDQYVLKGSCGVEYRLILTELGEEKYGKRGSHGGHYGGGHREPGSDSIAWLFWLIFGGVVVWMIYSAFIRPRQEQGGNRALPPPRGNFFGGGGGDDADDNDAPPPPYSPPPPNSGKGGNSSKTNYGTNAGPSGTNPSSTHTQASQGWRPGFWSSTAAATAAGAAGYLAGQRSGRQQQPQQPIAPRGWGMGAQAPEERWQQGSSSWAAPRRTTSSSSSGSAGPSYSSTRHESTGFGSTSRR